jgi:alkaline phosphatase
MRCSNKSERIFLVFVAFGVVFGVAKLVTANYHHDNPKGVIDTPKNIILLISDGCGYYHVDSASLYQYGETDTQVYEDFPVQLAMSTYSAGGGYDPNLAWEYFDYVKSGAADSAAAATSMSTGVKTYLGAIGVDIDSNSTLNIIERAEELGKATGVVTSVQFSHATPAAFVAHNNSRGNYEDIAKEMIYDSSVDVIMGCGHPFYDANGNCKETPKYRYVGGMTTWNELVAGTAGGDADGDKIADPWKLVQSRDEFQALIRPVRAIADFNWDWKVDMQDYSEFARYWQQDEPWVDIAPLLQSGDGIVDSKDLAVFAAYWLTSTKMPLPLSQAGNPNPSNGAILNPTPKRVLGVAQVYQTLQENRSGDDDATPYVVALNETIPTLEEMARAALNILDENPNGLLLIVEGGAIDWASHSNRSGRVIEEEIDFNRTVEAVVKWVSRNSNWGETLVIVTGDHETGYLAGPDSGVGLHSSFWKALINNGIGNLPGMEWHSRSHTNSLIPLYAKGCGAQLFKWSVNGHDPVRGYYIDNTDIAKVIFELLE